MDLKKKQLFTIYNKRGFLKNYKNIENCKEIFKYKIKKLKALKLNIISFNIKLIHFINTHQKLIKIARKPSTRYEPKNRVLAYSDAKMSLTRLKSKRRHWGHWGLF